MDLNAFLINLITNVFTPSRVNASLATITAIAIFVLYRIYEDKKMTRKLTIIEVITEKKQTKRDVSKFKYFKNLKLACNKYFILKPQKKYMAIYMYYGVLLSELVLFLMCFALKKPIFAFVLPPIYHIFVIKIIELLTYDIDAAILKNLPIVTKQMIKFFSKTNDLKTIIYEISKVIDDPLKTIFFNLSRKMFSESHEKCLNELADEINNTWMYAFVFLLLSYKEQSKKEDIISNLRILTNILDEENSIIQKGLTDKKPIALLNYMLLICGLAAFVLNLLFNKEAFGFFFNTIFGMICVIIGSIFTLLTIMVNIMLVSKREK